MSVVVQVDSIDCAHMGLGLDTCVVAVEQIAGTALEEHVCIVEDSKAPVADRSVVVEENVVLEIVGE